MALGLFNPSISFRTDNNSTDIRKPSLVELITALSSSTAVLLFHGYNNNEVEATDSYNNFRQHLLAGRTLLKTR